MQSNQSLFRKGFLSLLIQLLAVFIIVAVSSCKNTGKKSGPSITSSDSLGFRMNCVRLTKAQIQAWVDSGWTNPSNSNRIKRLLLQFYSASAENATQNMQLITYPGKSFLDVYMSGKDYLAIDTSCVPKTLSGPVVVANNSLEFDSLKITNPNGTLKDFSFIRLKPAEQFPPYINFQIEVVRIVGTGEIVTEMKGTDP